MQARVSPQFLRCKGTQRVVRAWSGYDEEARYFEEGVRHAKAKELTERAQGLIRSAYDDQLGHLRAAVLARLAATMEARDAHDETFAACAARWGEVWRMLVHNSICLTVHHAGFTAGPLGCTQQHPLLVALHPSACCQSCTAGPDDCCVMDTSSNDTMKSQEDHGQCLPALQEPAGRACGVRGGRGRAAGARHRLGPGWAAAGGGARHGTPTSASCARRR